MIPIIFIHRGYSWYLPYTLKQARLSNPRARILLVTDQQRPFLSALAKVETVPLREHWTDAQAFAQIYTHLSHNPAEFECFCFQRWYVLRSVMRHYGLTHCFHVDSDVLLYSDLAAIAPAYRDAALTVSYEQGPYSSYINDTEALDGFCKHITTLFREHTDTMRADYERWRATGETGGISDMHALKDYVHQNSIRVTDTATPRDGAMFDTLIHDANGCLMENGIKKILWRDEHPHAIERNTGNLLRLHSLHMQGSSKRHILTHHRIGTAWPIALYNRLRA